MQLDMELTQAITHSIIDGTPLRNFFDLSQLTMEVREDRVLYVKIKSGCQINMDDVQEVEHIMDTNYPKEKFYNLFDFPNFSNLDAEVREWAADKTGNTRTLADAIVLYSLPQKMIANFYLRVHKPPKPTKVFSKVEDALVWLKGLYN